LYIFYIIIIFSLEGKAITLKLSKKFNEGLRISKSMSKIKIKAIKGEK
jgi:hypothetical protein